MRKALLLGVIAALTISATAYAAATVTNVYTVHANLTPTKSGTKATPRPIGGHLDASVTTNPKGQKPNVIKTVILRIQGITENTNQFPACSSSRLTDPSQGPSTCPKGSLFATGFFMAFITPQGKSAPALTCRADVSLYNGGNHTVTWYVYKGAEANACPLPQNEAFVAALTKTPKGQTESATFPNDLLHPTVAGVSFDAAIIKSSVNISKVTKQMKVGKPGHKKTVTIGLFASTSCPANHQRQVALTFRTEHNGSRTVTRNVRCT